MSVGDANAAAPEATGVDKQDVARIAAAIHGVEPQDLIGEDLRQQRRARQVSVAAIVGLALATVGGGVAIQQYRSARKRGNEAALSRVEAEHQRLQAKTQSSMAKANDLAQRSQTALPENHNLALMLALEGVHVSPTPAARASLLRALVRYPHLIAARSLDGQLDYCDYFSESSLAVASAAGVVQVVDSESGTVRYVWPEHTSGPLDAFAVNRSSGQIAAAFESAIVVWNPDAGTLQKDKSAQRVTSLVFNPQGSILFAGSSDGSISTWNLPKLAVIARGVVNRSSAALTALAVRPDGRALAIGDQLGDISLLDALNLRVTKRLRTNDIEPSSILSLDVSTDGSSIVAAGLNHVAIWNLERNTREVIPIPTESGDVVSARFDGSRSHVWFAQGKRVLELAVGDTTPVEIGRHSAEVRALALHPKATEYVSSDQEGILRRWDTSSNPRITTKFPIQLDNLSPVRIAVSPQAERLAVGASDLGFVWGKGWSATRGYVTIWNQRTGHQEGDSVPFKDTITGISFDPTGRLAYAVSRDGELKAWAVGSRSVTASIDAQKTARSVALTSNGERVLLGLGDGGIAILDASSLATVGAMPGRGSPIISLQCVTERTAVTVSADGSISKVDISLLTLTTMGERSDASQSKQVIDAVRGPDCSFLVLAWTDGTVEKLSGDHWANITALTKFPERTGPTGLTISNDGEYLGINLQNGELSVWSLVGNVELGVIIAGSERHFYAVPEAICCGGSQNNLYLAHASRKDVLRAPISLIEWERLGCAMVAPRWSQLALSSTDVPCPSMLNH
ncbi:MAG TPA: WD40 repeat domain-containing protein [Polyangiaceae bacterium]